MGGGVITGVDYGHGLVSGVGAVGNTAVTPVQTVGSVYTYSGHPGYAGHLGYAQLGYHNIGKRSADAYTPAQVALGLPGANAVKDGHAHNPGVITNAAVVGTYALPPQPVTYTAGHLVLPGYGHVVYGK